MTAQMLHIENRQTKVHALDFYGKLGYNGTGEVFMDAGIPHRKMERSA